MSWITWWIFSGTHVICLLFDLQHNFLPGLLCKYNTLFKVINKMVNFSATHVICLSFDLQHDFLSGRLYKYNTLFKIWFVIKMITRSRNNSRCLTILIYLFFLKSSQITWVEVQSWGKSCWHYIFTVLLFTLQWYTNVYCFFLSTKNPHFSWS